MLRAPLVKWKRKAATNTPDSSIASQELRSLSKLDCNLL